MPPCEYFGCDQPAHGPKPSGESWHLCKGHQTQLEELVGFWVRGKDRGKVVKEMTGTIVICIRRLRAKLREARQ